MAMLMHCCGVITSKTREAQHSRKGFAIAIQYSSQGSPYYNAPGFLLKQDNIIIRIHYGKGSL